MSWFATLQAQPWFSTVSNEFATYAPSVSPALWEGELLSEDSSLSPTIEDYANSGHYGLFQENANFPTTVGLAPATTAELQQPEYNAYVAALAMQKAIQNSGATTLVGQVQALEAAGWPGAISSGETSTRVANVEQVLGADGNGPVSPYGSISGLVGSGNLAGVIPGVGALIQGKGWNAANQAAASANAQAKANNNAIATGFGNLGQSLLVGGIIIATLTGGFVLLATSVSGGAPHAVPVPV